MRLVLDLPKATGNARMHWRTRYYTRTRFWEAQDNRQRLGLIEPPPNRPMGSVTVLAHFLVSKPNDPDNLTARLKDVMDWLKTRGYIVDDGPSVVKALTVTQETVPRKDCGLVLDVVALGDAGL